MEGRGRSQWWLGGSTLESWRVCRPVVTDHQYEEQDPDPHLSDTDPQLWLTPAKKGLPVSQIPATNLSPASTNYVTLQN
jgi:hypothetical protein